MPHLLSIAINDYPDGARRLRGCLNDSIAWTNWFSRRGWETESLWNEQATGERINEAIGRLMREATAGDRLAIHFSGHGSQVPDTGGEESDWLDECYVPWDVATAGPVRDDQLYNLFQLRPAGVRLYLIADCCHSGSLQRRTRKSGVRYFPLGGAHGRVKPVNGPAVARSSGLLLAACGEAERAREITVAGRTHGVLSYLALRTLDRLPAGATHRQWLQAILAARSKLGQTPRLVGSEGLMDKPVFGEGG